MNTFKITAKQNILVGKNTFTEEKVYNRKVCKIKLIHVRRMAIKVVHFI